jgi:hypothetical protein
LNNLKSILFVLIIASISFSCRKESFITAKDARLFTSVDSLAFDTVFVNSGSVTKSFKIFNNNDQKLLLSSVRLSGGDSSSFKINIDGTSASEARGIEINPNDSIYVFVQINVDATNNRLPFILKDSIEIAFNGNQKFVQLQGYGQNAVFLKNVTLKGNVTWTNTLPYVILGGVRIDTNAVLKMSAGTKIFLHADAAFIVDGTLIANGTKDNKIIFSGDRMDADYKDLPASWPGIYFRSASKNNSIKYVVIKNAYQGIIAQQPSGSATPKLTLSHSVIDNIFDAGILAINTNITADNCLISNCGSNINIVLGGQYRFVNCTVASFGNFYINHNDPILQVADFLNQDGINYTAPLNAFFQNCIFWGEGNSVDDEIIVRKVGSGAISVTFDHVLYKAKNSIAEANFVSSVINEDPQFDSIDVANNIFDFHITKSASSPAINAGTKTSFPNDLDGKLRDATPDIGCYEK